MSPHSFNVALGQYKQYLLTNEIGQVNIKILLILIELLLLLSYD